ncbi:hypothetical protein GA565_08330 [Rouxiella sp. S1S-2]|uniref:hypothetical protein n=1 Tax=Rouxiella sp. S1S-2 TaxID=2653856 RepID=UPI00126429EE|nr:hypothetical protein [Rouxiella sp. S1S-2]KAB7895994.1 hypothetical protein GA565_08330 [Rouxiella sp. S1S-2]
MINKSLYFLAKIFNCSLLLHVSHDMNFDTVDGKNNFRDFRISFLQIPLGEKILYFLTYKIIGTTVFSRKNFKFFYSLKFDSIQKRIGSQCIDTLVKQYEQNVSSKLELNQLNQQEAFLTQRISECNDSISNVYNRISYYLTIMLAFFGVITYLFTVNFNCEFLIIQTIYYYLILIIIFDNISLAFFIKKGLSVNSFHRSSFKDLRTDSGSDALAKSLYRDWTASKNDTEYFVGILKNSEKYMYRIIVIGIITLSLSYIPQVVKPSNSGNNIIIESHSNYPTNSLYQEMQNETLYYAI